MDEIDRMQWQTVLYVLRDDEDTAIWFWRARQSEVEDNIWVSAFSETDLSRLKDGKYGKTDFINLHSRSKYFATS